MQKFFHIIGLGLSGQSTDDLQKDTFHRPKCRLLQAKRPSFTSQKATFQKYIDYQSLTDTYIHLAEGVASRLKNTLKRRLFLANR